MSRRRSIIAVLRNVRDDRRGLAAIEFAIVAPVAVLMILGSATYFASGREDSRGKRATYTAADMIARQTGVTDPFLANVKALAEHVATADARAIGFRVTSVTRVDKDFVVDWSYATTPYAKLTTIGSLGASPPDIASGQSVIVVETSTPYTPLFGMFGTAVKRHNNISFARPRTVSRISKT